MKPDPVSPLHQRLKSGRYVLSKLACSGMTLLLLTLLSWSLPSQDMIWTLQDSEYPVPLEYWVYGYGMTATIAADAILFLMPALNRLKQAALYASAGFLFFYLGFASEASVQALAAIAGALTTILFFIGKMLFREDSLLTPLFALVVPLVCLSLL